MCICVISGLRREIMRTVLFWVVTQRLVMISHRRFGKTYRSHLQGQESKKSRVEATEMEALRRSSRISRKQRSINVTVRQQIGLEEPIIKEIEQNQLTWYGYVQRMAEGRLPKIAYSWIPKQREHEEDRRKTG